jgi:hypothetical protein
MEFQEPAKHQPTPRRSFVFDMLFGVIVPLLCLIFDPAVFKSSDGFFQGGLLSQFRVFAYVAIGIGVSALALWLFFQQRMKQWGAAFSGIFRIGYLSSALLGIVLIPFSIMGILLGGIGILGFLPIITSFTFHRNWHRARQAAKLQTPEKSTRKIAIAAALLTLALPAFLQWQTSRYVSQSIQEIIAGDTQTAYNAAERLQWAFWCSDECYFPLAFAYRHSKDEATKTRLATIYQLLAGKDIQSALASMSD